MSEWSVSNVNIKVFGRGFACVARDLAREGGGE